MPVPLLPNGGGTRRVKAKEESMALRFFFHGGRALESSV
jgi:hypothetical protein